jgi:hypothetical protein
MSVPLQFTLEKSYLDSDEPSQKLQISDPYASKEKIVSHVFYDIYDGIVVNKCSDSGLTFCIICKKIKILKGKIK